MDFIGIVFYKQGADGKDVEHINEFQQQIGEKNSKYATVGDDLKLPAGIYSVYIISWGKRELMMKNGNLTDYLAKTILTVKWAGQSKINRRLFCRFPLSAAVG